MPASPRAGAALILALVILAALLLLGVPFLISQTSQVGSIRAFAQAAEARRGLATAETIGLALAVYQFYDPVTTDGTYAVGGSRQHSVLPGSSSTQAQVDIADDGTVTQGGSTVANVTDRSLAQRSRLKIFIEALRAYERSGDPDEQAADAAKLSLTISDESGKLDPNAMSVAAWDALLKTVGIADWDDDDVDDSEDSTNHGGSDTRDTTASANPGDATNGNDDDGPHWPPGSGTAFNDDNDDSDRYGELARALAELRGKLKGNRITDLDQLLLANPGHNLGTGTWSLPGGSAVAVAKDEIADASAALGLAWRWQQAANGADLVATQRASVQQKLEAQYQALTNLPSGWPSIAALGSATDAQWDAIKLESGSYTYGTNHDVVDTAVHSFGFRPPLTRAELARLKPYLTLHNPGQGRDGGISDLGTVVAVGNSSVNNRRQSFIDADLREVAGVGTWLRNERREPKLDQSGNPLLDPNGNPILDDRVQAQFAALDGLSGRWNQGMEDASAKPFGLPGDAFAVQIPPIVNLNAASEKIFAVLAHAWPRNVSSYTYGAGQSIDIIIPPAVLDLDFATTSTTAAMLDGVVPLGATSIFERFRGSDGWELLNPLFGWFDERNWDSKKEFTRTRIEMPAAGFTSTGVVRIDASSVVSDRADHPVAQSSGITIAQALPQETALEKRWLTQADLHALVVQRHASFCTTGPAAAERVLPAARDPSSQIDEAVTARPNTDATLPTAAERGWLQTRPWPNHATGFHNRLVPAASRVPKHLSGAISWRADFGLGVPEFLSVVWSDLQVIRPDTGDYTTGEARWKDIRNHLGPDGLDLTGTWATTATITGLSLRANAVLPSRTIGTGTTRELAPFHLSFWMKPQGDWNSGNPRPIFETRLKSDAGLREDGTTGDPLAQNYLGLWYDPVPKLLVLVVAPPSVEVTADRAYREADPDLVEVPVDARSASVPGEGNKHKPPATVSLTTLWNPNRILYCYKMAGGLDDRWHHLHVVITGTRPGEMALIVDGLVGRDVARSGGTLTDTGDHVHLPQVLLATALPSPIYSLLNAVPRIYDPALTQANFEVQVQKVAGLSAAEQFPRRGMLLIGDEYLSYEDCSGNTFSGCRRGRRQRTNLLESVQVVKRWPNLPAHIVGTRVVPAGVRFRPSGTDEKLWRGGWVDGENVVQPITLAAGLGTGDSTGRTWATVAPVPGGIPVTAGTITLAVTENTDFPPAGIVKIGGQYRSYSGFDGTQLTGVAPVVAADWSENSGFPANAEAITVDGNTPAVLVAIRLNGDALQPGVMPANGGLAQFMDAPGNIEWVSYTKILRHTSSGSCWMLGDIATTGNGFGGMRSQARTQRRSFATGSTVLPVQRLTGAHRLATGDAVTVVRQNPASTDMDTNRPITTFQAWIRYRPEDQPDVPNGAAGIDVDEDQFAFAGPIPFHFADAATLEFLVGPAWNGADLSPVGAITPPPAALPRFDLNDPTGGYSPDKAELAFAAGSPTATTTLAGPLILDGACAGPWDNASKTARISSVSVLDTTDPLNPNWSATSAALNDFPVVQPGPAVLVVADKNIFDRAMGLVQIDGEVFAWRKPITGLLDSSSIRDEPPATLPNQSAILFGRNLLTDKPFSGGHPHQHGHGTLTALVLPVGPVAMVGWDRRDTASPWFQLTDTAGIQSVLDHGAGATTAYLQVATPIAEFDAPAALVCNPIPNASNHTERSVLTLIGPRSWSEDPPSWQPSTEYVLGDLVKAGVRIYRCVQAGRSGSSAPTLQNTGIVDGLVKWDYIPGQATISEFTTGTWLAGLYGTPSPPWRNGNAAEGLRPGDLVIGWWPRYASPLPNAGSNPTAEHLRSRMRSWAGFPFRLRGAVFDPVKVTAAGAGEVATVEVLDSSPDDIEVVARAMAFGADWTVAPAQALNVGTTPNRLGLQHSPTDVFGFPVPSSGIAQFLNSNNQPVNTDGAELRLAWQLPSTWPASGKLTDIARAGGSAPRIGAVRLRCLAPTTILASERR